jgi:hypothetical protein
VLQVLTTFTSDARDLLEVRRSEASLKGRVAELSSRLKVRALRLQSIISSTCCVYVSVDSCSNTRLRLCSGVLQCTDVSWHPVLHSAAWVGRMAKMAGLSSRLKSEHCRDHVNLVPVPVSGVARANTSRRASATEILYFKSPAFRARVSLQLSQGHCLARISTTREVKPLALRRVMHCSSSWLPARPRARSTHPRLKTCETIWCAFPLCAG